MYDDLKNITFVSNRNSLVLYIELLNLFAFKCRINTPSNMLLQNKEEILQVIHLMTKDRFTNDQIRSIITMVLFVVHKYDTMMKFLL